MTYFFKHAEDGSSVRLAWNLNLQLADRHIWNCESPIYCHKGADLWKVCYCQISAIISMTHSLQKTGGNALYHHFQPLKCPLFMCNLTWSLFSGQIYTSGQNIGYGNLQLLLFFPFHKITVNTVNQSRKGLSSFPPCRIILKNWIE